MWSQDTPVRGVPRRREPVARLPARAGLNPGAGREVDRGTAVRRRIRWGSPGPTRRRPLSWGRPLVGPEFGELLGKGSALVVTGSSGGRTRRQIHHVVAECVAGVAVREDSFDSAALGA